MRGSRSSSTRRCFLTGSVELLAALVEVFKPALLQAYRNYVSHTNGLADYESVRLMRTIVAEEEQTLRLLQAAYRDLVNTTEEDERAQSWADTLRRDAAGRRGHCRRC